jgi:hypothetical protein
MAPMSELMPYVEFLYTKTHSMVSPDVTARTTTPTKVDSKLSDAHLESLKRREGEGDATKA